MSESTVVPTKTCRKCGVTKPAADFLSCRRSADGLHSWCRECSRAYDRHRWGPVRRAQAKARRDKLRGGPPRPRRLIAADHEHNKICHRCHRELPRSSFCVDRSRWDGLSHWCRECHLARQIQYRQDPRVKEQTRKQVAAWRAAHLEQHRKTHRAWRKAHRERINAQAAARRKKNPEASRIACRAYRQRHPDRSRATTMAWRKRNADRWRAYKNCHEHRRRARKAGNGGSHTVAEWEAILRRYRYRCLACGRDGIPLTKDHVLPIIQGGTDDASNLQPLCATCNAAKGAQIFDYRPSWDHEDMFVGAPT